jgi:formylglycine-generating enzyme required for sulfatase activity
MIVVPAGSFTMGSPENEKDRHNDEGPQHTVIIGKSFAVGKYDVTFTEWDAGACLHVSDSGWGHHDLSDSGWGRGDRPAINVSWDEAKVYVAWLSHVTG